MNPSYDSDPVIDDPRITQQVQAVFDQGAPQPAPTPHPMESFGSSFFTPVTNFGIAGGAGPVPVGVQGAPGPTGTEGLDQRAINYALGMVGANPDSAPKPPGIQTGIQNAFSPEGAAQQHNFLMNLPVVGGLLGMGESQLRNGPLFGDLLGMRDPGLSSAERMQGRALGLLGPENTAGKVGEEAVQAVEKVAPEAIDALRGAAGGALADVSKAVSGPYTQAQIDAVFGDANAARVTAAASGMPQAVQDAVRRMSLDPANGLTPEIIASTDKILPLIDRSLQANGAEITDANRLEVAQQMIGKAQVVNQINAARGGPKIEITDPVIADAVAQAGPAAQPVVQRAQAAAMQLLGSPNDYGTLIDRMRAEGASESEIAGFVGKGNMAPPQGPRTTAIGSSESPPPSGGPPVTGTGEGVTGKTTLFPEADVRLMVQRKFTPATALQVMNQIVYTGLIAPTVSILHPLGSITSSLLHFPEQILDSGADALIHGAGITKDRHFTLQASVNGLKAQMVGTGHALGQALPQIMRPLDEALVDADIPSEVGSALLSGQYGSSLGMRGVGAATQALSLGNMPLRTIAVMDNSLIRGLTDSFLLNRGYEAGMREGLAGRELDAFATNHRATATTSMIEEAVLEAKRQLNRQPPEGFTKKFMTVKNATGPVGTVLLPFFNRVVNVLKATTTWTPLGFARLLPPDLPLQLGYFGHNTVTEAARVKAVVRAGVGTVALYSIWQQVLSDNITGDGPSDSQQKGIWAGDPNNPSHVARSIRLPTGQWMTYGKIPIIGDYLAVIADTAQAVRDNKARDVSGAQAAASGLLNYFANEGRGLETAAATIGAVGGYLTKPGDKLAQAALVQQLAGLGFEMTPYSGIVRSFGTVNDPRYEAATPGQSGLARLRADYAANFPAGAAGGVASALGGQPGDVKPGAQRVPGVTGGVGALLPIRVSGPTAVPVEGQAAGMPPTLNAEATRLSSILPNFKPPTSPADKIGPVTDQIKLSGSDYISYLGYAGQARNDAVNKLLLSKPYQNATPDIQARLLKNAVTAGDKAGEAEFLKQGVIQGLNPADAKQQVILGLAALSTARDKANWLSLIDHAGKLTPELRNAVDASRTPPLPGQPTTPTVAQYLHAAPLVNTYLAMKPYLIGNPQQWVQVGIARNQMSTYLRDNPAPMGVPSLDWFQQHNPATGALVRKYSYAQVRNPQRETYLKQHPEIGRFVGGTSLTQAAAPQ